MGITAAILGTTGYTGMVLLRLLQEHPEVSRILPGSSTKAGCKLSDIDQGFAASTRCSEDHLMSYDDILNGNPDVVFSCLPHLASARYCKPYFDTSVVIDLSADFRIPDPELFFAAYGETPPLPHKLKDSVYGLAEFMSDSIKKANLLAVPGCYPTATLLPLIPIVQTLGNGGDIIVNALSGISGAGKKAKENLIYNERSENMAAYNPGRTHRHTKEIQYYLDSLAPRTKSVQHTVYFTPHLIPMKRGMQITSVLDVLPGTKDSDIREVFQQTYSDSTFVRIVSKDLPETRAVRGSNSCLISWHLDNSKLFLFSAIDNLVKGASGQALQCMNLRFGFPEKTGLPVHGEV